MSDISRFGVSIDEELLTSFDQLIGQQGYATRSEALGDLMRDALIKARLAALPNEAEILASLTIVYNHHAHELATRMTEIQHDHPGLIVSVLHVHLSHDDCLEVIILRGQAQAVRKMSDSLLSLKGVKHGQLFTTTAPALITASTSSAKARPHTHQHSPSQSAQRLSRRKHIGKKPLKA